MPLGDFVVNNWPLFLALAIISYMLARTWFGAGALVSIRPAEAVQLLNHKDALVLDVRSDKEYQEGHIVNAMHIPLGILEKRLSDLKDYKKSSLIVVCRSGTRSSSATTVLSKQGFESVKNLHGGMLAWGSANLPVTTAKSKRVKPAQKAKEEIVVQPPASERYGEYEVQVYTTRRCPFCTKAIDLLEAKDIGYTEISVENDPELRTEMENRAEATSIPQIFIGEFHVGGCDDLYALEDEGKLEGMLGMNTNT